MSALCAIHGEEEPPLMGVFCVYPDLNDYPDDEGDESDD